MHHTNVVTSPEELTALWCTYRAFLPPPSARQALRSLADDLHSRVSSPHPALGEEAKQVLAQLSLLTEFASSAVNEDPASLTLAARDFSLSIAQTYAGAACMRTCMCT